MADETKEMPHHRLRRELGNPYREFGYARLTTGMLCCAVGVYAFSSLLPPINAAALTKEITILLTEEEGRVSFLVHTVLISLFSVGALLAGILSILAGLKHIVRFHPPGKIPGDFNNLKQLLRSFSQMEILTYRTAMGWPLAILRLLFSENVAFLPPSIRRLCVVNIAYLPFAFLPIAFLLLLNATSDSTEIALGFPLIELPMPKQWIMVILAMGLFRFLVSLFLVPGQAPAASFHRSHHTLTGSAHPESYVNKIEQVADDFRYLSMPNRIYQRRPIELKPAGDPSTGKIKGGIFFETQPIPADRGRKTAGHLLLWGGFICLPASLILLMQFPVTEQLMPLGHYASTALPELVLHLIASVELFRNGFLFFGQAKTILGTLTYTSDIFLIEFSGTYFKGEISAGMATSDSLRATSTALRSEVVVRYHAASCLSESVNFADRDLLETTDSLSTRVRIDTLMHSLEQFQDRGARLMGIDFEDSPTISRLAGANISLQAKKESAMHHARTTGILPANLPHTPGLLTTTEASPPPPADDLKECPECAELIRAKAKKCRFCSHRFDESADGEDVC